MIATIAMLEIEERKWREVLNRWQFTIILSPVVVGVLVYLNPSVLTSAPFFPFVVTVLILEGFGVTAAYAKHRYILEALNERIQMIYQLQTDQ